MGPKGELVHGRPQRLHLLGQLEPPLQGFGDYRRWRSLSNLGLGAAPPAVRSPVLPEGFLPQPGGTAPQLRLGPPGCTGQLRLPLLPIGHLTSTLKEPLERTWVGVTGHFDQPVQIPLGSRPPFGVGTSRRFGAKVCNCRRTQCEELAAPALLVATDKKLQVSHHAVECLPRFACPAQDRRGPLSSEPDVFGRCARTRDGTHLSDSVFGVLYFAVVQIRECAE